MANRECESRANAAVDGESESSRKKSDLARAFSEDGERKTHVGGQALIEGVMMRGKYNWAVGVREASGGVYVEEHDLASGKNPNGWLHWPLVRGCRALVESLVLGYKALEIAALHAFADEEDAEGFDLGAGAGGSDGECAGGFDEKLRSEASQPSLRPSSGPSAPVFACSSAGSDPEAGESDEKLRSEASQPSLRFSPDPSAASAAPVLIASSPTPASAPAPAKDDAVFGKKEMAFSMVLGLVLGVVLFIVAPAFLTNLIVGEYDSNTILWNIVDGVLRVAVFVFYLWLIGRMSDIKRMFGYHGAEHKTIHCYEHGLPLTPECARSFPRLHVRCGTAFLIMVMIIAIFVYTVVPVNALILAWGVPDGAPKLLLVILIRIVFMPVIAGISYEITVKWAGAHPDNPLVKVILWPGMQMQYLTTNEPDDSMLECAIAAMECVLAREGAEAAKAAEPQILQRPKP